MSDCRVFIDPYQPAPANTAAGTVTSVDFAAPLEFIVGGNPIVAAGTITLNWVNQLQNLVFASPNGVAGIPTFRGLVAADIPTLPYWNLTGNAGTVSGVNFIGTTDAQNLVFKSNNIEVGRLYSSNVGNVMFGTNVAPNIIGGSRNIGLGSNVFSGLLTGTHNFAAGENCLQSATTATYNFAVGDNCLQSLTTGTANFAHGVTALEELISGSDNIAIGRLALQKLVSNSNCIALGNSVLAVATGADNIGMGLWALHDTTTGYRNIGIGTYAWESNTDGIGNIALGYFSGHKKAAGDYNVVMGYEAGGTAFTDGDYNVLIGYQARLNGVFNNTIIIGNVVTGAATNEIRIGNATNNKLFIPAAYNATSASAANLFIDANGQFFRSTTAITGLPTGTNLQTLVNVAGTWTATSNLTFDNTNKFLGIDIAVPLNDISFGGNDARVIAVERSGAGAGKDLSINAGAAVLLGTDISGGNLYLSPGLTTGTGISTLYLNRYAVGASGQADNPKVPGLFISSPKTLTNNTAIGLFRVTNTANTGVGGSIEFTIIASDGVDIVSYSGSVHYAAVNKAGVYSTSIVEESATTIGSGAAAVATTWTVGNGGVSNYVEIKINANVTGIVPTTLTIVYKTHNGSLQAISIL